MNKENQINKIRYKEKKREFSNIRKILILFVLLVLIVPFYESKIVFLQESQAKSRKNNIFSSLVLKYAQQSEKIKTKLGWRDFFEKEDNFWIKIKNSPIISQKKHNFSKKISGRIEKDIIKRVEETSGGGKEIAKKQNKEKSDYRKKSPFKILIIGDSFIAVGGGVGDVLERALLAYKGVNVVRKGKVSSGLSRPDYYNWPSAIKELISLNKPDIAIIMLGANDAQSITDVKSKILFGYGTIYWEQEYKKRVSSLLKLLERENITVFWLGLPIMRNRYYSAKIKKLNLIYEAENRNYKNAYFIPTWKLLSNDKGDYAAYLPDKNGRYQLARISDGIHLQYFGGSIVVRKTIKKMKEILELNLK